MGWLDAWALRTCDQLCITPHAAARLVTAGQMYSSVLPLVAVCASGGPVGGIAIVKGLVGPMTAEVGVVGLAAVSARCSTAAIARSIRSMLTGTICDIGSGRKCNGQQLIAHLIELKKTRRCVTHGYKAMLRSVIISDFQFES